MKDFLVEFDDLPDEVLLHIFKTLYNVDALYSLLGVNQRFNRILNDPIFTTDLCFLQDEPNKKSTSLLPGPMLDRFCSTILPEIGHQVKSLHVEPNSMDRILRATDYPKLFHLSLRDLNIKTARSFFTGKRFSLIYFYCIISYS